jgi:type III pantothenate kinase
MKPDLVVDVGNSRIKWGRCLGDQISAITSLSADPAEWVDRCKIWGIARGARWAVSGVDPLSREALIEWIETRGDQVTRLDSSEQLPLRVLLAEPDRVGIDRLLNAVAARHRCPLGKSAIIVDAGSAVTVDWLDETGAFAGGVIFPGVRLMAKALHEYTALLPLVTLGGDSPPTPGKSTLAAIQAGIHSAVVGGVKQAIRKLDLRPHVGSELFVTGGDAEMIVSALTDIGPLHHWPAMTLEGIRLSAEALQEK